VHVRHERRDRHAAELGGERRRGREDVGHGDVGRERPHLRDGLACRLDGRLERLERALAGREDLVLGRGGEPHPGGLGRLAPALPGVERDRVTARHERRAEREHRERVPGIAERAEVDAQHRPAGHSGLT
jgi:hypothetical protein